MHYDDLFWYHEFFKARFNSFIYDTALEGVGKAETLKEKALFVFSFLMEYNRVWYLLNEDGKRAFENLSSHVEDLYRALSRVEGFLRDLKDVSLEDADLERERFVRTVNVVFDEMAKVCGWTGASKVLHLLVPDLFVMWDDKIRSFYAVSSYVDFLRKMKDELNEALDHYCRDFQVDRELAKDRMRARCDNRSLTKLIDEYNFLRITEGEVVNDARMRKIKEIMAVIREVVAGALEVAEEDWAKRSSMGAKIRGSASKLIRVMEGYAKKGDLESMMKYYEAALGDPDGITIDKILVQRGRKSLKTEYIRVKRIYQDC